MKVAPPRSFCSEHTVEYVLVPPVVEALAREYEHVIPIYFWANREGNATSTRLISYCDDKLRVVSVFPRRPKVTARGQQHVLVKFNAQLFDWAAESEPLGIPVFAGVPLASCLTDLTLECPCMWFHLAPLRGQDMELHLPVDGSPVDQSSLPESLDGPLELDEVARIASRLARDLTWDEVFTRLKDLRSNLAPARYFLSPGGYKPFHLLLLTHNAR